MAVERRVGDEVLARLEDDLAGALRVQRRLDGGEDRVVVERERLDVVAGEVADLDGGHALHSGSGDGPTP